MVCLILFNHLRIGVKMTNRTRIKYFMRSIASNKNIMQNSF